MKRSVILTMLALTVASLALLTPLRREAVFFPMGGIPVKVAAYGRNYFQFRNDVRAVEARVRGLEDVFSRHKADSELSKLNSAAFTSPVAMGEEMERLIELSGRLARETGGAFDPGIGPLVELWKEAGRGGNLPKDGELKMGEGGVATSGNYERYSIIGGKKYSHIIDPRNGRPIENSTLSATVAAKDAATADALATAFMVMGIERAKELAGRLPEIDFVLIEEKETAQVAHISERLAGKVELENTEVIEF